MSLKKRHPGEILDKEFLFQPGARMRYDFFFSHVTDFSFFVCNVVGQCCLIQPPNSGTITRTTFVNLSFALHASDGSSLWGMNIVLPGL